MTDGMASTKRWSTLAAKGYAYRAAKKAKRDAAKREKEKQGSQVETSHCASSSWSLSGSPSSSQQTSSTCLPGSQDVLQDIEAEVKEETEDTIPNTEVQRLDVEDKRDPGRDSSAVMKEAAEEMKGLKFLKEDEKAQVLQMPDFLIKSIGIEFGPNVEAKERILRFFERYNMGAPVDFRFRNRKIPDSRWPLGHLFVCTLVTPSLFNRTFEGPPRPTFQAAENETCFKFLVDKDVVEIMKWLPPPAHKVRKCFDSQLPSPKRRELEARGINMALLREEVKQDFFARFRDMGCRSALWDGNA